MPPAHDYRPITAQVSARAALGAAQGYEWSAPAALRHHLGGHADRRHGGGVRVREAPASRSHDAELPGSDARRAQEAPAAGLACWRCRPPAPACMGGPAIVRSAQSRLVAARGRPQGETERLTRIAEEEREVRKSSASTATEAANSWARTPAGMGRRHYPHPKSARAARLRYRVDRQSG